MYNLTKKEKLLFIKEQIEKKKISAYTISKNTDLTEAGVGKILNGTVKNPHESSINTILLFLEKLELGSNLSTEADKVEEEKATYEKEISKYDLENNPLVICLTEKNKLTMEVIKLQQLLRANNIDFKNIFEEKNN